MASDIWGANAKIEKMDALPITEPRIYTFAWAKAQYDEDFKGRLVKKSTRVSYANTLEALEEFLKLQKIERLDQITVEILRRYRAGTGRATKVDITVPMGTPTSVEESKSHEIGKEAPEALCEVVGRRFFA